MKILSTGTARIMSQSGSILEFDAKIYMPDGINRGPAHYRLTASFDYNGTEMILTRRPDGYIWKGSKSDLSGTVTAKANSDCPVVAEYEKIFMELKAEDAKGEDEEKAFWRQHNL